MSRRRPGRLARFIRDMATWQLVLAFGVAVTTVGVGVGATAGHVEREYGMLANWLGLARRTDVNDVKAWQLYESLKRVRRQIKRLSATPENERKWVDNDLLQSLHDEEQKTAAEYARVLRALHPGEGPRGPL